MSAVTTQAELDAALARGDSYIEINSPRGVWLTIRDSKDARIVARDSSSVEAWGSSSVEAWDSSSVVAWDSSSVVARDSSSVEAWGSSSVVAWDSSSVEARDSSSVEAWDSSSVVAWDSSSVVARDSSSVEAWGSSSVVAWDSSSVHTYGPGVNAGPKVAVFLHSAGVLVEGGVVIDVTDADREAADWCGFHGAEIIDGRAIVYKAVGDNWSTPRGFVYAPGAHLTAKDWRDTDECGYGLHFGPTPRHARDYHRGATRYVQVSIPLDAARPITGGGTAKIKARECLVLGEVDVNGKPVATEKAAS